MKQPSIMDECKKLGKKNITWDISFKDAVSVAGKASMFRHYEAYFTNVILLNPYRNMRKVANK